MSELIDTTEMYLRTIFELVEEGVPPLRARICERLHQSGPTVSQTVSRMERDGLVKVRKDRQIELTPHGWAIAGAVMRKHRLVERLLFDVIGLDWKQLHDEACRWEHVVSTEVEQRLVEILPDVTRSPYGNPIPGLAELRDGTPVKAFDAKSFFWQDTKPLSELVKDGDKKLLTLSHASEWVQSDSGLMADFDIADIRSGSTVQVSRQADNFSLTTKHYTLDIDEPLAAGIFGKEATEP